MDVTYLWLSPIKQNSPEEEAELKKLKDIEKSVEQTAKKLEKVGGELTGLKNVSKVLSFLLIHQFLMFSYLYMSLTALHLLHRVF